MPRNGIPQLLEEGHVKTAGVSCLFFCTAVCKNITKLGFAIHVVGWEGENIEECYKVAVKLLLFFLKSYQAAPASALTTPTFLRATEDAADVGIGVSVGDVVAPGLAIVTTLTRPGGEPLGGGRLLGGGPLGGGAEGRIGGEVPATAMFVIGGGERSGALLRLGGVFS